LISIALPLLIGLALVAGSAIPILMTEKWIPIIIPLQILCLVNVLRVSAMIMPYTLAGRGDAKAVLNYQVLSAAILIPAFLIGVHWGINGILLSWIVSSPILYVYLFLKVVNSLQLGARSFVASLGAPSVCISLMAVAVMMVPVVAPSAPIEIRLVGEIAVGALVYMLAFYLFFGSQLHSLYLHFRKSRSVSVNN